MFGLNKFKTISAALVVVAAGWAGAAQAVTYTSCVGVDYDLSDNVDGAVDCEISSASQDFLNTDPITVNADGGFFDVDTWVFEGKLDEDGTLDGAEAEQGLAGSFDLTDYFAGMTGEVLLVFKDGAGTTLVGYLFELDGSTDLSQAWTTPFECPPFENNQGTCRGFPKNVSHISVYSNVAAIPVPAAGLLLIGALGALGLAKRRRRAA